MNQSLRNGKTGPPKRDLEHVLESVVLSDTSPALVLLGVYPKSLKLYSSSSFSVLKKRKEPRRFFCVLQKLEGCGGGGGGG